MGTKGRLYWRLSNFVKIGYVSQILGFGVMSLQDAIVDYICDTVRDISRVYFALDIHISQSFSTELLLHTFPSAPTLGHLSMFGDIFDCHNLGGGLGVAIGI